LNEQVEDVVRMRLDSEYARIAPLLPPLLSELHRAFVDVRGKRRSDAAKLLTQAYRAADALADKFGYFDLSARIIGLLRSAARESGDNVTIATAAYVRTEVYFASGDLGTGRRLLERAADSLAPVSTSAAAAYGALHMRAAVTAARAGDRDRARAHLDEADDVARRVPEGIYSGTAFGPASVRIHRVTLAVDLLDIDSALHVASGWTPPASVPAERRSHYFIDSGRAHLAAGRHQQAIDALLKARRAAPQHVREHPDVRRALADLLSNGRREIVGFAEWAGVPEAVGRESYPSSVARSASESTTQSAVVRTSGVSAHR
jgi:tetratricopeptide (TPR) repeat protein